MKEMYEIFSEETIRVEKMFLLATALTSYTMPSDLQDFFSDEGFEVIEGCFGPIDGWAREAMDSNDREGTVEWLIETGKLGFLIEAATPIMKWNGSSASYSWGYYTSRWVYGDTLREAHEKVFAFAKEQREKEKRGAK